VNSNAPLCGSAKSECIPDAGLSLNSFGLTKNEAC
jgi:hypothetical protein